MPPALAGRGNGGEFSRNPDLVLSSGGSRSPMCRASIRVVIHTRRRSGFRWPACCKIRVAGFRCGASMAAHKNFGA